MPALARGQEACVGKDRWNWYRLPARDRSEASRLEARIKKLSRADKLRLIADDRAILDLINP